MAATTLSPFQQTAERASQVEELLRLHPTTETLNRDATLFQLPLRLPGGIASALRIALPASFPSAPPTLSLTNLSSSGPSSSSSSSSSPSLLRHTWVDSTSGLVSCPSVLSWALGGSGSRLARAVGEAVEALREGGSSDPNNRTGDDSTAGPAPPTSAPEASFFPLPRGTTSFEELDNASEEQLLGWLGDAEAFASLARRVAARVRGEAEAAEAAAEAAAATTTTTKRNPKEASSKKASSDPPSSLPLQSPEAAAAFLTAKLASATLAREQELREVSNQVAVVRATELAPAAAAASSLRSRARVVAAAISPQALVEALRNGAAEADADSARCYDAFLAAGGELGAVAAAAAAAGNSSSSPSSSSPPPAGAAAAAGQKALDSFLEEYVRLRSKFHERELKQQAAEQTLL